MTNFAFGRREYTGEEINWTARNIPVCCYVKIAGAEPGQRIGIIKRGESGYYRTDFDHRSMDDDFVKAFVDDANKRLGVTSAQATAMQIGSMMGWDVPGADASKGPAR